MCAAPKAHLANLMYDRPADAAQAKFSLEYGLAVGLLTGNATLADYVDEAVTRPEVTALLPLVRKEAVDRLEAEFPTQVHVTLRDGRKLHTKVSMAVGTIACPLTDEQLWDKFDACLADIVDTQQSVRIRAALENLDSESPAIQLTSLI